MCSVPDFCECKKVITVEEKILSEDKIRLQQTSTVPWLLFHSRKHSLHKLHILGTLSRALDYTNPK